MITYKQIIEVYLDGILVGTIRPCIGGYYYQPIKNKSAGDIFETIEDVKASLQD